MKPFGTNLNVCVQSAPSSPEKKQVKKGGGASMRDRLGDVEYLDLDLDLVYV